MTDKIKELLSEEMPEIYAKKASPYWFMFADYELLETADKLIYIKPKPNAKLEQYKPFDLFPKILEDFFELLIGLPESTRPTHLELTQNKSYSDIANEKLLKFCKKYGLFGLHWEQYKIDCFTGDKRVWTVPGFLRAGNLNTVFSDYCERTLDIIEGLDNIRANFLYWDKSVKEEREIKGYPINFSRLNLGTTYRNGEWQLVWNFQSLLEALSVMYLLNFTNQMGEGKRIKPCALKGCNRPFLGKEKDKYCCPAHGATHRKRREREWKRNAEKLFKEGRSVEEISRILNLPLNQVKKWAESDNTFDNNQK